MKYTKKQLRIYIREALRCKSSKTDKEIKVPTRGLKKNELEDIIKSADAWDRFENFCLRGDSNNYGEVPAGKHICKYCGNMVDGDYEDELCDECKQLFGHSLYSEL